MGCSAPAAHVVEFSRGSSCRRRTQVLGDRVGDAAESAGSGLDQHGLAGASSAYSTSDSQAVRLTRGSAAASSRGVRGFPRDGRRLDRDVLRIRAVMQRPRECQPDDVVAGFASGASSRPRRCVLPGPSQARWPLTQKETLQLAAAQSLIDWVDASRRHPDQHFVRKPASGSEDPRSSTLPGGRTLRSRPLSWVVLRCRRGLNRASGDQNPDTPPSPGQGASMRRYDTAS